MWLVADPFDRGVGLGLICLGLWLTARPGVARWQGVLLAAAGATWLVTPASVGRLSTLFVHRPLLAAAVLAPALRRRGSVILATTLLLLAGLTAVSLVPMWATDRWLTFVAWSAVIVATALIVRPAPWTALAAEVVLAVTASLAHLAPNVTGAERRAAYHAAVLGLGVIVAWRARRVIADDVLEGGGRGGMSVGFREPGEDGYRDAAGAPFTVPAGARTLAVSGDFGDAVLVHDDPAFVDPAVHGQVSAAVALLARNVGLVRQIDRQKAAVAASQERLVAADRRVALMMREEVEHDVLPHLAAIAAVLDAPDPAGATLLAQVRDEIRALSSGLGLEAFGDDLPSALAALADGCPLDVALTVDSVADRWISPATAMTVYMVASEALANAVKHSGGSCVEVHFRVTAGGCALVVSDDGRGGATDRPGGGLMGIGERVAVLGGALSIASEPRAGTVVTALLPATLDGATARQPGTSPTRIHGT